MLPLPYASPWNWLLYALAALDLGLLAAGLVWGQKDVEGTGRLPRPLRLTLSAILLLAALLGWRAAARSTDAEAYAALVGAGMVFGFVGDLIMARVVPTANRLVAGMLAFGLGHVLYIGGFLYLLANGPVHDCWRTVVAHAILIPLGLWAWWAIVRRPGGSRSINAGSLAYALLMSVMVALAVSLILSDVRYWTLAFGVLLFLCSDLVLGNWQVKGHVWSPVNDVVWSTYVVGQLLIVYSVAIAVRVMG